MLRLPRIPIARALPHAVPILLFAVLAVVWTWPLALHLSDHVPGIPGDNFAFLWNLWWMREALDAGLNFFRSPYLFSPFGVDLVNHPHTALQAFVAATLLAPLSIVEAQNLWVLGSVFLNAICAYALIFDLVRERRPAVLGGILFGASPYLAGQLMGHFDLLNAWVLPLFALWFRRALASGRVVPAGLAGLAAALAAWSAYYYVVYQALFAVGYTVASWDAVRVRCAKRHRTRTVVIVRRAIVGLSALVGAWMAVILLTGGIAFTVAGRHVSAHGLQNPLLALWLLGFAGLLTTWTPSTRVHRPPRGDIRRAALVAAVAIATFVLACAPLLLEAIELERSGRYVTQPYFWRSAPRGIDALAPFLGPPFHPVWGGAVLRLYESLGLSPVEAAGWIGVVPVLVLLSRRGEWLHRAEAKRWMAVAGLCGLWALGPFLTVAGQHAGLPLPQALARFVPLVNNARMPGRAMVMVYLALGVLAALRLAGVGRRREADGHRPLLARPAIQWTLAALLAIEFLNAPVPLTALPRPAVYAQLAARTDDGPVIEVPFAISDGLAAVPGQDLRQLYHATLHGHPVVGGYAGRMAPHVADAYDAMPVVGDLRRLAAGGTPQRGGIGGPLPFRYLVLNTEMATPAEVDYVRETLHLERLGAAGGRELYLVLGLRR